MKSLSQRCRYNLKLKEYTLFVCILFVVSLSSCSDNPVTPGDNTPKIVDSSRFYVETEFGTLNFYERANIHVIDTSEFFLYSEFPSAIGYFKNRVEQYFPTPNRLVNFAGNYKSKILFGVTINTGRGVGLYEWNGNGVNELVMYNAISNEDTLYLKNASIEQNGNLYMIDHWGRVFVFDGQAITMEELPDLPHLMRFPPRYPIIQAFFIIDDWDNRVTLGFHFQEGRDIGDIKRHVLLYKLFDDGWKKIHADEVTLTTDIEALKFYKVNNNLIKLKVRDVYLYSQGDFVLLNSGYKSFHAQLFTPSLGNSPNDFFNIIEVEPDPKRPWERYRVVHWNGINYSIEIPELVVMSVFLSITNVSEDVYMGSISRYPRTAVFILTKKLKNHEIPQPKV